MVRPSPRVAGNQVHGREQQVGDVLPRRRTPARSVGLPRRQRILSRERLPFFPPSLSRRDAAIHAGARPVQCHRLRRGADRRKVSERVRVRDTAVPSPRLRRGLARLGAG